MRKVTITPAMRKEEEELRSDSFLNQITGIGVNGRDATRGGKIVWDKPMSEEEVERIYAGSGLAKRICDLLPKDALRQWVEPNKFEQLKETLEADRKLGVRSMFKKGASWGRMYGRAHIFINTGEDSTQWEKPLDLKQVREIKSLLLLNRWELVVDGTDIENDPSDSRFGMPRCYRLAPHRVVMATKGTLAKIHHSRLLTFHGSALGLRLWITNNFSDDSIFHNLMDPLTDFIQSNRGVAVAMNRFRESVHSIKNLAQDVGSGSTKGIQKRINYVIAVMSVLGERVIDLDNEKIEFFENSFAGVPDVLDRFQKILAANTEYPAIVLFQESPEGSMGGNGSSELEGYYNTVGEYQEDQLRPLLDRYYEVLFAAKNGPTRGQVPKEWSYTFPKLWQMTRLETAQAEFQEAQADTERINKGTQDEIDIIEKRFPDKADQMTPADKDAMREAMAQEKAARAAQVQAALEQGGPVVKQAEEEPDPKAPAGKTPKPAKQGK